MRALTASDAAKAVVRRNTEEVQGMIGLWSEIRSGMLSFNSVRERNTDILYQRRALRRDA